MSKLLITAALAVVLAAPAMAQGQGQKKGQAGANKPQAEMQQQESSKEARACLDELERLDRRLAETGYGRVGPDGYGVYGGNYSPVTRPPRPATALRPPRPRDDMYTLMRAGHLLALNGYEQGCQNVVQAVRDIGNRYEEMIRSGELDEQAMRRWRGDYLASAVAVTELEQPLRVDEIIGSDLRSLGDEDLGDIEDVVLAADGSVRYVMVSTGGFLGMGEEHVPVPWSKLRITPSPYRDTFVMDISQEQFDRAPRLADEDPIRFVQGEGSGKVDAYWDKIGQSESK